MRSTGALIARENAHIAHTYHPLPIVVATAKGSWVTDVEGNRYLDCLSAHSAVHFGHGHPHLIAAAKAQLDRVTLSTRAFHNDQLCLFVEELAAFAGKEMVILMNTDAEAVEAGVKLARAWGSRVKGVDVDRSNIIVVDDNLPLRTTAAAFSTARTGQAGTSAFKSVPFGDAEALEAAIDENTVAVLIEPIQGEAGVVVPPTGYLQAVREATSRRNVLLIADEIESGLGRTGATFECDHAGVIPDLYLLGKALGGGIVPVSAVVGDAETVGVLGYGEHDSNFGGNALAAAVGREVISMLETGEYQERSRRLGEHFHTLLVRLVGRGVLAVRGTGLWAGVDIDPALGTGREVCERLMERGVLAKDIYGSTIQFAPPLVVEEHELDWAVGQLASVLDDLSGVTAS